MTTFLFSALSFAKHLLPVVIELLKVLIPFSILSFIQNMAFTASSRSRNSGDPNYHRWCAYMSNGVYYITNALLTVYIIKYGKLWQLAIQGLAYTLSTAEGSVLMMRKMLAKEKGKRSVGAGQDVATFTKAEGDLFRTRTLLLDNGDGVGTFTLDEISTLKGLIARDEDKARQNLEAAITELGSVPNTGDLQGYGPDLHTAETRVEGYGLPNWLHDANEKAGITSTVVG